jgi:probable addiction module antidote protein
MAACLEEAPEVGGSALVAASRGNIARAKEMTLVACDTGLRRESLHKALSPSGNPEFATVMKVIAALGLTLHAAPASAGWPIIRFDPRGDEMTRLIQFLLFLSTFVLSFPAYAQLGTTYEEGPVTELTYLKIEYGHFDEYVEWLNSTWKPLNEAKKKAGLIVDYRVFTARPRKPEEPNVIFMITYPDMAAFDRRSEENEVAVEMIGTAKEQDAARIARSAYRTRLGTELIREVILK